MGGGGIKNNKEEWKTSDSGNSRQTCLCQSLTLIDRNKETHTQTRRMGRCGLAVVDSWELGVDKDGCRPIVRSEQKNFEVSGIAGLDRGPQPVKVGESQTGTSQSFWSSRR
jgi:hypothetical protein